MTTLRCALGCALRCAAYSVVAALGVQCCALHDPSGVPVILIGNKCDKKDKVRSACKAAYTVGPWDCGTEGPTVEYSDPPTGKS